MDKKKYKQYTDYAVEQTVNLLGIDSPTGYTEDATNYVMKEFKKLGYKPELTGKSRAMVDSVSVRLAV